MPAQWRVDSYKEKGNSLISRIKRTPSSLLPPVNSHRGFAQVILLLFLLAGIAVGTIIIQNRTNFLPHAQEDTVIWENPPEESQPDQPDEDAPGEEGRTPEENPDDANSDQGGTSDNGSGNQGDSTSDQAADGQSLESQDPETQRMFRDTYCPNNNGVNCDAAKQRWVTEHDEDVVNVNDDKVTTSDGQSLDTQNPETQKMFRDTYCPAGTTGNCDAAKQQWAREHAVDATNSRSSARAGGTPEQQAAAQADAAAKNKAELDRLRAETDPKKTFRAELDDASNLISCVTAYGVSANCPEKVKALREMATAQAAYDYVNNAGLTGVSQTAAYDQAKLMYRSAACDAVAAGVKGANCVLDLGDRQNLIKATVNGEEVRVFLGCSVKDSDPARTNEQGSCRKVLNYRGKDGQIHELDPDVAKQFVKDGKNPREIYSLDDLKPEVLTSARDLCRADGRGCIAAGQPATPPAQAPDNPAGPPPGEQAPAESCNPPCSDGYTCVNTNVTPLTYECTQKFVPPPP